MSAEKVIEKCVPNSVAVPVHGGWWDGPEVPLGDVYSPWVSHRLLGGSYYTYSTLRNSSYS